MKWIYREKSQVQLKNWYYSKPKDKRGFMNFHNFYQCYLEFVKDKSCHYCKVSERDIQMLVHVGKIKSKRFPLGGKLTRGVNRGYWLEIDRKTPNGKYYKENCVPCCYFCNNDKSDIFNDLEYKKYMKNRYKYLNSL